MASRWSGRRSTTTRSRPRCRSRSAPSWPSSPAPTRSSSAILPKHILEQCTDMTTCDFNLQPVGTGPFKFVEYVPGQRLVLEAHDDYHQGRPGVKQVVRLAYPNEQSALAALKSGEIDITGLREAGNVTAAEQDPNITVHRYDSNWIFAGRMNMDQPGPAGSRPCARPSRMRSIARTWSKRRSRPTATVGNSPISIGWAASPDVPVFGYDPEKAKTSARGSGLDRRWHPAEGRSAAELHCHHLPGLRRARTRRRDAAVPAAGRHRVDRSTSSRTPTSRPRSTRTRTSICTSTGRASASTRISPRAG